MDLMSDTLGDGRPLSHLHARRRLCAPLTRSFGRPFTRRRPRRYIESFNGRLRDECLNQSWFVNLRDAPRTIEAWRVDYNVARSHSGLVGDALDFWRVEEMLPDRLLRLHAEMKLPGRAWLQFEVTGDGPVVIRQTATFDPIGVLGLLYWYALLPVHVLMFAGMLRAIARSIVERSEAH
jgi:hypothetical protein